MPRFSANLGFLFADRPLLARIDAAAACGFSAVEMHYPYDVPAIDVRAALDRHDLVMLAVNARPGDPAAGEVGLAALAGREAEFVATVEQAVAYQAVIGGNAVHCLAGVVPVADRADAIRTYAVNIRRAADIAAAHGLTVLIEPLNRRDTPGYFLARVEQAVDLIAAVGRSNVKLMFDCYHVQIMQGDLITRLETFLPLIGHVQIAGVPARAEPDEGEINYPAIFATLDRVGYAGWVGVEYRPRAATEAGLGWGRDYGLRVP